jgi:hypothetical protein
MTSDQVGLVILGCCFALGIRSTLRLRAIHRHETPPRNLITGAFYATSLLITLAAGYFGLLSARRVLGFDPIAGSMFLSLLVASAVLLIPVGLDYTVTRIRNDHSDHAVLEAQGDRIEAALAVNTGISQEASDHADAAYVEANAVNQKIAAQGDRLTVHEDLAEHESPS